MVRIGAASFAMAVIAVFTAAGNAWAMDHLRVGDPSVNSFSFLALAVGIEKNIFQTNGVEIERISVSGSAKLHQAMIAGSLDIAVGAGTDMAFAVKGAPEIAVAAMAGPPLLFGFVTRYDDTEPDLTKYYTEAFLPKK
jgi:ABC-type nitrate/sulfonate/bicarbonate transport system substrate-binding protein